MRIAVVSDVHGNLNALDAVLAEVEQEGPDELWCLGDLVGYGPRPTECCRRIRERASLSLCGNHDLAVAGRLDLAEFAGEAAIAARWTVATIDAEARAWLAGLEPQAQRNGVELFHASPRDPVWEYVLSDHVARRGLQAVTAPLVLVGHSHIPLALHLEGEELTGGLAPSGFGADLSSGRWLLNPGSVGQPRDGDRRAAWLLVDTAAGTASFRRVEYDIARTQAEIADAGLPPGLAGRLALGQ